MSIGQSCRHITVDICVQKTGPLFRCNVCSGRGVLVKEIRPRNVVDVCFGPGVLQMLSARCQRRHEGPSVFGQQKKAVQWQLPKVPRARIHVCLEL